MVSYSESFLNFNNLMRVSVNSYCHIIVELYDISLMKEGQHILAQIIAHTIFMDLHFDRPFQMVPDRPQLQLKATHHQLYCHRFPIGP